MSSLQILQGTFRLSDTKTLQLPQLTLNAGDSWAFVGSNGSGKSALARALAGELPLLKGERQSQFSHITRLSFEQLQKLVSDEWQRNNTDMLSPGEDDTGRTTAEIIQDEVKDTPRCMQLAQQFGITALLDRRFKYLSTGETRKTLLCQALMSEPDLLILDEPTNHLDMKTKDILKQAIKDFNGTVIVVSHDREFLDGLVDKVYEFGNKRIKEHLGGIYDFLQRKKMETLQDLERNNNVGSKSVSNNSGDKEISETKLSYEERKELQRQIKRLEKAIADNEKRVEQIEAEIQSVEEQLASPEGASDTQLYEKHGALKKALDEVMENWTEHSEQLEKLRLQDL